MEQVTRGGGLHPHSVRACHVLILGYDWYDPTGENATFYPNWRTVLDRSLKY